MHWVAFRSTERRQAGVVSGFTLRLFVKG